MLFRSRIRLRAPGVRLHGDLRGRCPERRSVGCWPTIKPRARSIVPAIGLKPVSGGSRSTPRTPIQFSSRARTRTRRGAAASLRIDRQPLVSASNPGPVTISAPRRPGLRPTAASWDSQRAPARFQQLLFTVAGLALLPAAAATLMRVLPPSDDATALLAAFIPYGLLGYLIALVCLLVALVRARHRLVPAVITAAVVVLTAYHLAWLAPLFFDDHRTAAAGQFRLMSLNMFKLINRNCPAAAVR